MSKHVTTDDREQVIEAFLEGVIIRDDHISGGGDNRIYDDVALVELNNSNKPLALFIIGARYQSLNGVYLNIDNHEIHLGQASIAGAFMVPEPTMDNIHKYNDSCTFDGSKIKRIVFRDGSKITV